MNKLQVILFTDLIGSTALYDRLGSQKAFELIKTKENLLFPLVKEYGGRIIKTIGDSIMAVFSQPDFGVECAIEMQRTLERERNKQGKEPLFVRIGLNWGEIIPAGTDVFGDAVNVAARMESLGGANHVLISRNLYEVCSAKTKQICCSMGPYPLKGKKQKIEVFQVTWRGDFSEYKISLPPQIGFKIFLSSVFNLLVEGISISRGGFESYAKSRNLQYTKKDIVRHNIHIGFITLIESHHKRHIFLYDDRLWQAPTAEFYQENMLEIFCEAQNHQIKDFAIAPTGRVHGFSRVKAIQSSLNGYAKYLQIISMNVEPYIRNLYLECPDNFSNYDIRNLSTALESHVKSTDFFTTYYSISPMLMPCTGKSKTVKPIMVSGFLVSRK